MSKILFTLLIMLITFLKACALEGTMYQVIGWPKSWHSGYLVLKAIFSHHTPFYPVVFGRNVGIYLSWEAAFQEVNGWQVRKFKKMRTFIEAVEFMLTRGNASTPAQLTSLPPHAAVSPLTPSYSKFESMLTRAMAGTVPPLRKQTQSVTDTADVLSTLSLDVGELPQPSILKPTKPEPRNIYHFV
ncbi:hypothetical protein F4604DRAFT_1681595 [Suillus subluteus]|nr:hypothetical protein F4604DRAFT_1681595 [Suillus subluteus]